MLLKDVQDVLSARWLIPSLHTLQDRVILRAFGADLMSDILAHTVENTVLITGLTTGQVVKTARLIDLGAIVFVRGKQPGIEMSAEAEEYKIPLLSTNKSFYECCGLLYQAGLPGCMPGEEGKKGQDAT